MAGKKKTGSEKETKKYHIQERHIVYQVLRTNYIDTHHKLSTNQSKSVSIEHNINFLS